MMSESKPRSTAHTIVVTGFVMVVMFMALGLLFRTGRGHSVEKALEAASAEINKACPRAVDAETRLIRTDAGPGNVFTYKYIFVNRTRTEADLEPEALAAALRPGIVNAYKTDPGLKVFRDNGVTMHYRYSDKNGVFITDVVIVPDDLK